MTAGAARRSVLVGSFQVVGTLFPTGAPLIPLSLARPPREGWGGTSSSWPASAGNRWGRGGVGGASFNSNRWLNDRKHTGRFKLFSLPLSNQSEDRKSFRPPFLVAGLSSRIRILLRRCTIQFFDLGVLEEELEPEAVEDVEPLGVCEGVLFFPGVFGVDALDLLTDWGVLLCLPALPGVLPWLLASAARKSRFAPLCLDVVLQAWQVAISVDAAARWRRSSLPSAALSRRPAVLRRRRSCSRCDGRRRGRSRTRCWSGRSH